ncbi:MAG: phage tail protein [Dehalococcoidia bacterium]|nr:phage tail protein [Dehalococcoidia bacterium]
MPAAADPLVGFNFALEIQGKVSGYFTEVSGIGSENEVIEQKVMESNGKGQAVRKIPGRLKWGDITLKRGITAEMDIWKWRKEVEDGNIESARHDGAITMYDSMGTPVAQWTFDRAWPSKVTGPAPKADGNEVSVEEVVITHEGTRRVQ